jgi:hypothetical protein
MERADVWDDGLIISGHGCLARAQLPILCDWGKQMIIHRNIKAAEFPASLAFSATKYSSC